MAGSSPATEATSSPLAQFSFPRTGKRGVPQQFPRRLYEMLDSETKQVEASIGYPKVICWSESGKAFRIYNVAEFSETTLPKYFRTKKFSSFQRNLNLYGFAKVRRGPDSDMYAHPSFMRDRPELLLHLRKTGNGARSRRQQQQLPVLPQTIAAAKHRHPSPPSSAPTIPHVPMKVRPVSPSTSHRSSESFSSPVMVDQTVITSIPRWTMTHYKQQPAKAAAVPKVSPVQKSPSTVDDRGKLDLLTLALDKVSAI